MHFTQESSILAGVHAGASVGFTGPKADAVPQMPSGMVGHFPALAMRVMTGMAPSVSCLDKAPALLCTFMSITRMVGIHTGDITMWHSCRTRTRRQFICHMVVDQARSK
jgi:hypothetical protein